MFLDSSWGLIFKLLLETPSHLVLSLKSEKNTENKGKKTKKRTFNFLARCDDILTTCILREQE